MKKERLELKCAICGEESMQTVTLSSGMLGVRMLTQLDLRVVSERRGLGDFMGLGDRVQECPHCHYVNYDIRKKLGITAEDLKSEKYQEVVNSEIDEVAKKFILNAILLDMLKQEKKAGMMYHHASWVFDDLNDSENADKYRKEACERILKVALEEDDGDTALQCVDLLRRNGEFSRATELLKKIGVANIEEIDKVIAYEKELIKNEDRSIHYVEEAMERELQQDGE